MTADTRPRAPRATDIPTAWALSAPTDTMPFWRLEWRHAPRAWVVEILVAPNVEFFTGWVATSEGTRHTRPIKELAEVIRQTHILIAETGAATGERAQAATALAVSRRRIGLVPISHLSRDELVAALARDPLAQAAITTDPP